MSKTPLIASAVLVAGAALAVLVVLPAETGWDPTGVGAQLGLTVLLSGLDRDNPVSQPLDTFYRSMILRLTGSLRQFDARAIAGVRADISDIARSFFG